MESQRRLSHAALNPELDKFCAKVKKAQAKMVTMYTKYEDHGATYYYLVTRGASYEPALDAVSTENQGLTPALKAASTENQGLTSPYRDRVGIALYMAGYCLSFKFFASYINYLCYELRTRVSHFFTLTDIPVAP